MDFNNLGFNFEMPTAPTRPAFGLTDTAQRSPLLNKVFISQGLGQVPSGGFKVVGNGGYSVAGDISAIVGGVGQIADTAIGLYGTTNQTKDF